MGSVTTWDTAGTSRRHRHPLWGLPCCNNPLLPEAAHEREVWEECDSRFLVSKVRLESTDPQGCLNGHQKESGPEMLSPVSGSQSDPTRKAWAQSSEETELER